MDNYPLIEKFNIMKVPTIIVLRDGLYVTGQVGYYGFDALSVFLEEANAI
jgi:thioredoxin-like negative regulator of GroEL